MVATVGGTPIDQRTFSNRLVSRINRLQTRFNSRLDAQQIRALGLPDQVIGELVTGALLDQQADAMRLAVSDAQIKRRIVEDPQFQDAEGTFQEARFVQALRTSSVTEQQYVNDMRRDIQRSQLVSAATDAVAVSRSFLATFYTYREERRIAETILVPASDGADLPTPDDEALAGIHVTFAERFQRPEYRSVSLVELRASDLVDEIVVDEEEVRIEFEARRDEFSRSEARTLEQVVLDTETQAQGFRDALDDALDFTAAAQSILGQSPVTLSDVTRDELALQMPDLAEAIFSLNQGGVGGPLESPFGWHVFRVNAVEPAHDPEFEELREQLAEELARRAAIDSLVSIANQLDDELAAGASLEEAAAQLSVAVRKLDAIDRSGLDRAGEPVDLLAADQVVPAIFATAAGEESLLTETPDGDYHIFRVDGVTPASLKPLAEVREEVTALWREEEARAQAQARAEALAAQISPSASMAEVAAAEGLALATTGPIDRLGAEPAATAQPQLTARLFELAQDEVATAPTNEGWLVVKLVEVRPGDPSRDPGALDELASGRTESMKNDLFAAFTAELQREYSVEINQQVVETVLESF
jgi:peptidyl-prolyl cis-trans isomerase D